MSVALKVFLMATMLTCYTFPLPECFWTDLTCPDKGAGTCEVFKGKLFSCCGGCKAECPRSKQSDDQRVLKKLKFSWFKGMIKVVPEPEPLLALLHGPTCETACLEPSLVANSPSESRARSSPIFLLTESFLI
jgi:hypothetical protein